MVSAPTSLTEAAMQAMAVDADSEQVTQDPAVEYTAEGSQSPSNGTLFEDEVTNQEND